MDNLSDTTRMLTVTTLIAVGTIGFIFYLRQNRQARMGGGISRAKALWLTYATYTWFFLTPILAFDSSVPYGIRVVLGCFAASMWFRGIIELFMLYVSKNWKPPYGIAHDVFSLVLLIVTSIWFRNDISITTSGIGAWIVAYLFFLTGSMVCETHYATVFNSLVAGQTTGDEGVWFASQSDPRFQKVNRLTALCNTPLVLFLAGFFAFCIV